MNERLKAAFDAVHAGEELKQSTRAFLAQRTRGYTRKKMPGHLRLLPVAACLVLVLAGGAWAWFTPTAQISIDINPSIELGINRFDRVVSVDGYNDDGQALAQSVDVQFMKYDQAVDAILEEESMAALLEQEEQVLTLAVVGDNGAQCGRILSVLETCTQGRQNAYCYAAHPEEMEHAHELGLSYGRYAVLEQLWALGSDLTPEQAGEMTMRELHDLLRTLSGSGSETQAGAGQGHAGGHGAGRGYGHGAGQGGRE